MSIQNQKLNQIKNLSVITIAIGIFIWAIITKQAGILYFYLALVIVVAIGYIWGSIWIYNNRRKGIYPPKGETTMNDVKRLALSGYRGLAIGAFREITGSSLKKATREVSRIISKSKK